jgi:hypothetical protein
MKMQRDEEDTGGSESYDDEDERRGRKTMIREDDPPRCHFFRVLKDIRNVGNKATPEVLSSGKHVFAAVSALCFSHTLPAAILTTNHKDG